MVVGSVERLLVFVLDCRTTSKHTILSLSSLSLSPPISQPDSRLRASRVARVRLTPSEGLSVRSYQVGNAGSRPISEAKQPWACLVLTWGTSGEAHVLYSLSLIFFRTPQRGGVHLPLAAEKVPRDRCCTHTRSHTTVYSKVPAGTPTTRRRARHHTPRRALEP